MAKHFYGISAYAGMHVRFPAKRFMRQYPTDLSHPAIAFILGCFGWDFTLLKLFCQQFADRPHLVEFHISNGPSRRSGRLGPGAFAQGVSVSQFNKVWEAGGDTGMHTQLQRFQAKISAALADFGNPNTHVLWVPELEDNLSDPAFANFHAALCMHPLFPRKAATVLTGRSPCTAGSALPISRMKEIHGFAIPSNGRTIGNLDGVSVDFEDGERYFNQTSLTQAKHYLDFSKGYATFLWSANQQGVGNASSWNSGWPSHKRRTFIVTDEAIACSKELLRGR